MIHFLEKEKEKEKEKNPSLLHVQLHFYQKQFPILYIGSQLVGDHMKVS
jgi:hypothetical protein